MKIVQNGWGGYEQLDFKGRFQSGGTHLKCGFGSVGLEGYNVLRRREVIHGTCLLGFFSDVRIGLFS